MEKNWLRIVDNHRSGVFTSCWIWHLSREQRC